MNDTVFLAWQYVRRHPWTTVVLIVSTSLILFIPLALRILVDQSAEDLIARAEQTPLLVGTKGSATDLTLSALYFQPPAFEALTYREVDTARQMGVGQVIPLHLRYRVRDNPIIGTSPEYFGFRGLTLAEGRSVALLGECVVGANAAKALDVGVGEYLTSTPAGAFDVAGSYPLRMPVVGILAPRGNPDDEAVFVDLKTTWVIAGIAHGHQDLTRGNADSLLLEKTDSQLIASAAVLSYTEITPDNLASFHFHGEPADYPVDALILLPRDRREAVMLRGAYEARGGNVQMVRPRDVIDELIGTMFSVRNYILLAALLVGLATLAAIVLVINLSIRLRRDELSTMRKIGASPGRIRRILGVEIGLVLLLSLLITAALTGAIRRYGMALAEQFFLN